MTSRGTPHRAVLLALLSMMVCATTLPAVDGELSILASMQEGDYGTDTTSEIDEVTARWSSGDRFQLRLDLPWVRVTTSEDLVLVGGSSGGTGAARRGRGPGGDAQDPEGPGDEPTGGAGSGDGQGHLVARVDGETELESAASRRTTSGLGDLRAGFGYRLSGGGARLHRVDLGLEVKVPTADEDDGLGTGEWDLRLGTSGQYRFWSATAFAGAGWTRYGDPPGLRLEDGLDLYAGVESQPLLDRLLLSGWLSVAQELIPGEGERSAVGLQLAGTSHPWWHLRVIAGLGGPVADWSVGIGAGFGIDSVLRGPAGVRR